VLQTALVERHRALGGRLIDFAGWEMPVQYSGILDEHRAVRERVGLFDLSHMGEVWISGPGAGTGLAAALVTDPPRLALGRAHYSMICAPDGGIIDDLIVYRVADDRFMVVPNASNRETVVAELRARLAGHDAALDDASLRTSLVAVQGPRAADLLQPLTDVELAGLKYYAIAEGHACGKAALIARTGYTGEDGFELFLDWDDALPVWDALLEAGQRFEILPCGLGARDTLRLEAGMPLYGNELDRDTNPYEAGLGRVVKLDKEGDFVGRAALQRVAADGPAKQLVGMTLDGRQIARHGYPLFESGEEPEVGIVTSGAPSPTLGRPIAMGYVPPADAAVGNMVEVAIRASRAPAQIVPMPFYKRS
jgi:aminomethyltransferase